MGLLGLAFATVVIQYTVQLVGSSGRQIVGSSGRQIVGSTGWQLVDSTETVRQTTSRQSGRQLVDSQTDN